MHRQHSMAVQHTGLSAAPEPDHSPFEVLTMQIRSDDKKIVSILGTKHGFTCTITLSLSSVLNSLNLLSQFG